MANRTKMFSLKYNIESATGITSNARELKFIFVTLFFILVLYLITFLIILNYCYIFYFLIWFYLIYYIYHIIIYYFPAITYVYLIHSHSRVGFNVKMWKQIVWREVPCNKQKKKQRETTIFRARSPCMTNLESSLDTG